jgi:hypothetical protein
MTMPTFSQCEDLYNEYFDRFPDADCDKIFWTMSEATCNALFDGLIGYSFQRCDDYPTLRGIRVLWDKMADFGEIRIVTK